MMSDDLQNWLADARDNKWVMPTAPWWKRLPVIRHVRAAWNGTKVARHASFYRRLGLLNSGYDRWVLWGMAHGYERKEGSRDE
jgi:hypothetical protein